MTEPTLTCPTCRTQIKLTESLAAPLIEVSRKRFEAQLARKEAEVAGREAAIRDQQAQIAAARDAIDAQVTAKVDEERGRIAAVEAQKHSIFQTPRFYRRLGFEVTARVADYIQGHDFIMVKRLDQSKLRPVLALLSREPSASRTSLEWR